MKIINEFLELSTKVNEAWYVGFTVNGFKQLISQLTCGSYSVIDHYFCAESFEGTKWSYIHKRLLDISIEDKPSIDIEFLTDKREAVEWLINEDN